MLLFSMDVTNRTERFHIVKTMIIISTYVVDANVKLSIKTVDVVHDDDKCVNNNNNQNNSSCGNAVRKDDRDAYGITIGNTTQVSWMSE